MTEDHKVLCTRSVKSDGFKFRTVGNTNTTKYALYLVSTMSPSSDRKGNSFNHAARFNEWNLCLVFCSKRPAAGASPINHEDDGWNERNHHDGARYSVYHHSAPIGVPAVIIQRTIAFAPATTLIITVSAEGAACSFSLLRITNITKVCIRRGIACSYAIAPGTDQQATAQCEPRQ